MSVWSASQQKSPARTGVRASLGLLRAIIARATVTINVLQQLGVASQSLPGVELAGYQTLVDGTEADLSALNDLINQLVPLLASLDAKAGPLDAINKKIPKTLRGLLPSSAQAVLLDQITGPTPQGGGSSPTPPPPTP